MRKGTGIVGPFPAFYPVFTPKHKKYEKNDFFFAIKVDIHDRMNYIFARVRNE